MNFLLSDSVRCPSLLPFVAALSGTRNASWMEWSGEENQNLKEFFHLFGRTRVVWHKSNERERGGEGDRQTSSIPFPFNKLPAGRSSYCFIHNEKERLLDTIWEGDNGIRGGEKTGKRRRNFPTSAAQNLPPLSRVFTSPLWGDDRAPLARKLAVNVTKKGIMARRRCLTKHPSFSPSPSARPSRGDR